MRDQLGHYLTKSKHFHAELDRNKYFKLNIKCPWWVDTNSSRAIYYGGNETSLKLVFANMIQKQLGHASNLSNLQGISVLRYGLYKNNLIATTRSINKVQHKI